MRRICDFIAEVFKGKSIYRILFNWQVQEHCRSLSGEVLDLASGGIASYYRYLPKDVKLIRTDYQLGEGIDFVVDLSKTLPLADSRYQNVLLFNAINLLDNIPELFKEINRIMSIGGRLYLSSLFIANEMPQPHDFNRLTYEGIMSELTNAGFSKIEIYRIGERATSAANILAPCYPFSLLRLFIFPAALLFDYIIPKKIKIKNPCPIGYLAVAQK
jgi:SAM-dependent methyltransferase